MITYDVAVPVGNDLVPVRMAMDSIDEAREHIRKLRESGSFESTPKFLIVRETTTIEYLAEDGQPL